MPSTRPRAAKPQTAPRRRNLLVDGLLHAPPFKARSLLRRKSPCMTDCKRPDTTPASFFSSLLGFVLEHLPDLGAQLGSVWVPVARGGVLRGGLEHLLLPARDRQSAVLLARESAAVGDLAVLVHFLSLGLSGRPAHPASGHEVEVKVEDRLSGFAPAVRHEPIVGDAAVSRDLGRSRPELPEQRGIGGSIEKVDEVLLRHEQDMRRRLRVGVFEGENAFVLEDLLRGDLARHDLAEDAVAHFGAPNLSPAGGAPGVERGGNTRASWIRTSARMLPSRPSSKRTAASTLQLSCPEQSASLSSRYLSEAQPRR